MMKIEICGTSARCIQPMLLTAGLVGTQVELTFDDGRVINLYVGDNTPVDYYYYAYTDAGNGFYKLNPLSAEEFAALKAFYEKNDFNALAFTDSRAAYQFYCLDHLWADVSRAAAAGLTLLNITSEPMTAAEVYRAVKGTDFVNEIAPVPVRYDLRSRHCDVMGGKDGYIYAAADVLPELQRFVAENS